MRIFVINQGSSSLKCSLYDLDRFPKQLQLPLAEVTLSSSANLQSTIREFCPIGEKLDAIGHRIVHGGALYKNSVLIDSTVKKNIRRLAELAPLHNLADLQAIEVVEALFKDTPQIAVFDTAFHHSLPDSAAIYPGPYEWVPMGIRRYGFHGTSFQYCSKRVVDLVKSNQMVICHLGAGASLCAVKDGKSVDTTMGFTPLEGLMMDTRCGSVDPGILLYLLAKKKMSVECLSDELYKKSGLLGLSGVASDMREILDKASLGDARAALALDVYIHRLNAGIASMAAALGGLDTLVFTAGIGENASLVRRRVCDALGFLGVELDAKKNEASQSEDRVVSLPHSRVNVLVIHTQEQFEIARECWTVLHER